MIADEEGQILEAHSISAGLDYPGVGPEHAHLRDTGRATYFAVTDAAGAGRLRRALAAGGDHPGARVRPTRSPGCSRTAAAEGYDVLCLSGRGDKDLAEVLSRAEGPG